MKADDEGFTYYFIKKVIPPDTYAWGGAGSYQRVAYPVEDRVEALVDDLVDIELDARMLDG